MTTSHNHKYSPPEVANKLNEIEIEETSEKSPKWLKSGRISKQKTVIFITIGVAVVILIIVGVIIGVLSNKNGVETGVN